VFTHSSHRHLGCKTAQSYVTQAKFVQKRWDGGLVCWLETDQLILVRPPLGLFFRPPPSLGPATRPTIKQRGSKFVPPEVKPYLRLGHRYSMRDVASTRSNKRDELRQILTRGSKDPCNIGISVDLMTRIHEALTKCTNANHAHV
jgi:hypothetical protein